MMTVIKRRKAIPGSLEMRDVLQAHLQFGQLNYDLVKEAMGSNWPPEWDKLGPGDGIFAPDEARP
jgi:hypothetical protein